jgi:hypothetical protein
MGTKPRHVHESPHSVRRCVLRKRRWRDGVADCPRSSAHATSANSKSENATDAISSRRVSQHDVKESMGPRPSIGGWRGGLAHPRVHSRRAGRDRPVAHTRDNHGRLERGGSDARRRARHSLAAHARHSSPPRTRCGARQHADAECPTPPRERHATFEGTPGAGHRERQRACGRRARWRASRCVHDRATFGSQALPPLAGYDIDSAWSASARHRAECSATACPSSPSSSDTAAGANRSVRAPMWSCHIPQPQTSTEPISVSARRLRGQSRSSENWRVLS